MDTLKTLSLSVAVLVALVITSCAPSGIATREEGQLIDPVMGNWTGHRVTGKGEVLPVDAQAIALGNMNYRILVRSQLNRENQPVDSLDATLEGNRLTFPANPAWKSVCENGILLCRTSGNDAPFLRLERSVRLSPALGAQPPAGAIWLFDGRSLDGWRRRDTARIATPAGWKVVGGFMEVVPGTGDILTTRVFKDFQLHIEFRTPFMPDARGQARGNSGVYLQGRYEVQVLDSYGLKGEDNECGAIYKVAAPRVNMCAPPGQWQSYDITFHAPQFNANGTKSKDAVITVLHNGVVIHENLVVPGPTGGSIDNDIHVPGGLLLQDHGNLVQYRNIWLVEQND